MKYPPSGGNSSPPQGGRSSLPPKGGRGKGALLQKEGLEGRTTRGWLGLGQVKLLRVGVSRVSAVLATRMPLSM